MSPTKKKRHSPLLLSEKRKSRAVSSIHNEEEIKREEVIKTREFQQMVKDLNISQIINDFDPNNLQLTKLRLMKTKAIGGVKNSALEDKLRRFKMK